MRPWHYLRTLKGAKVPRSVLFLDTEPVTTPCHLGSSSSVHQFRLGTAVACRILAGQLVDRDVLRFDDPAQWWEFRDRHSRRDEQTWVFAHNLGYDLTLTGFWQRLDDGAEELGWCCLADPPTIITTRRGRRSWVYVDVLNYWRMPLAALARSLGIGRLGPLEESACNEDWSDLCLRDVQIAEQAVLSLLAQVGTTKLCSWKPSAASLSAAAYRTSFLSQKILVHSHERCLALERASYCGGRLGCYTVGCVREPIQVYDVNSLYPYCMKSLPMPYRLVRYFDELPVSDLRALLRGYVGVAAVALVDDVDRRSLYPSPRPVARDGGRYHVLCGIELRQAVDACDVVSVRAAAVYQAGDIFGRFVDHFYAQKTASRESGNMAEERLCKLLLNSLHGKFAQRGGEWVDDNTSDHHDRWGEWIVAAGGSRRPGRYRALAGRCQRYEPGGESRESLPIVAACVAAGGRAVHRQYLESAGLHNVLYCATDSLHALRDGELRLLRSGAVSGDRLGKVRVKYSGQDGWYGGLHHWRVGSHVCRGFLAATAAQVADGVWRQDSFQHLERQLAAGILDRVVVGERLIDLSGRTQDSYRNQEQLVEWTDGL